MNSAAVTKSEHKEKRAAKTPSVERALLILELLASNHEGLSNADIQRKTGYPKTSISYLLRTLVKHGYARRDPDTGKHTLGMKVVSLVGRAMQGMKLREVAILYLRQIVESTGLGAHLAVLDHGDAVYIERVEAPGFIKMDIWNGKRAAPQTTAIGKALICYLRNAEVQEIVAMHPIEKPASARTITSLSRLLHDLSCTRDRGYAIDDEEHAEGVRCVAAPVVDASGEVIAALGVSGTLSQLKDEDLPRVGSIVGKAALKLSAQLGSQGRSR